MAVQRIGVDVGGTKIEGVLLDGFDVIDKRRIFTPRDYSKLIQSIKEIINQLSENVQEIGVCIPGSGSSGTLKSCNIDCLEGKKIREDLENIIGKKITLENDANCFALAEAREGAAKNYHTVFGAILGTGIGGGIIIDGSIHRGKTGSAGEWGHYTLHPNGKRCGCKRYGCVEAYISGPALEKRWAELTGRNESLSDIIHQNSDDMSLWKSEFLNNFGSSMAGVIRILDPDVIVLGGGLSNIEFLYDEGRDITHERLGGTVNTPILKNKLGDTAGAIGACMIRE